MPESREPMIRVDPACPPDMVFFMQNGAIIGAINTKNGVSLGTQDIRDILARVRTTE